MSLLELTQQELDIIKAINLKDFDLLYRLGASGLNIDGFTEL
jgi:hypothetical protein